MEEEREERRSALGRLFRASGICRSACEREILGCRPHNDFAENPWETRLLCHD